MIKKETFQLLHTFMVMFFPRLPSCASVYKYEFVLILLQVFFHGIYAVPMVQGADFFCYCADARLNPTEMQITFRTILLEATLTCHGNTRGKSLALFMSSWRWGISMLCGSSAKLHASSD